MESGQLYYHNSETQEKPEKIERDRSAHHSFQCICGCVIILALLQSGILERKGEGAVKHEDMQTVNLNPACYLYAYRNIYYIIHVCVCYIICVHVRFVPLHNIYILASLQFKLINSKNKYRYTVSVFLFQIHVVCNLMLSIDHHH